MEARSRPVATSQSFTPSVPLPDARVDPSREKAGRSTARNDAAGSTAYGPCRRETPRAAPAHRRGPRRASAPRRRRQRAETGEVPPAKVSLTSTEARSPRRDLSIQAPRRQDGPIGRGPRHWTWPPGSRSSSRFAPVATSRGAQRSPGHRRRGSCHRVRRPGRSPSPSGHPSVPCPPHFPLPKRTTSPSAPPVASRRRSAGQRHGPSPTLVSGGRGPCGRPASGGVGSPLRTTSVPTRIARKPAWGQLRMDRHTRRPATKWAVPHRAVLVRGAGEESAETWRSFDS